MGTAKPGWAGPAVPWCSPEPALGSLLTPEVPCPLLRVIAINWKVCHKANTEIELILANH